MGPTSPFRPAIEALESRRLLAVVWALSTANQLVQFDITADEPQFWQAVVNINGLTAGEEMQSIDFRPATGELYGFSGNGMLYRINVNSGAATPVGTPANAVDLQGDVASISFDPVADHIRLVTNADENFRLDPQNGQVLGTDMELMYAEGDEQEGEDPVIVALAHDPTFAGEEFSIIYGIDSHSDALVRIGGANGVDDGTIQTVGDLGIDVIRRSAFDIYHTDGEARGLAILQQAGVQEFPQLYEINLQTGAATQVTTLQARLIRDMAIAPPETSGVVLTADNRIGRFDTMAPGAQFYAPVQIFGLQANENVISIDFRPENRVLYGVTDQQRVYEIDIVSGFARSLGPRIEGDREGERVSMDFNPAADAIRVVTDAGENLRVSAEDGSLIATDPDLTYPDGGDDPLIVATAYSRNLPDAPGQTSLFHIDANRNALVRQGTNGDVNAGQLFEVGPLGLDVANTAQAGMDIFTMNGTDTAWLVLTPAGAQATAGFYGVNLNTGMARRIGDLAGTFGETQIIDIALDPRTDLNNNNA